MPYQTTLAKGQKQQALAQALAGKAFSPAQHQQGAFVAPTGMGDSLTTLAAALASRRMGKKADQTLEGATEQRNQALAQALGGSNPQYAQAQSAIDAGADPGVMGAMLKSRQPTELSSGAQLIGADGQVIASNDAARTGADPSEVAEYKFAQSQGYAKPFPDYLKEFKGRERNVPAALQVWEMYQKLGPKERTAFLESQRSLPIENIGQVPTQVGAGAAQNPLSSLPKEADAKERIAEAAAQGTNNVIPADRILDAQAKEPRIAAATRRLQRVTEASDALGTGGGPIEGRVRGWLGTEDAQELEASNAQLINELTALTRTPGVGSQSDLEQRLATLALPSASQHPSVRAKSIKELDAFIKDLDSAISRVGGGGMPGRPGASGGWGPPGLPTSTASSQEDPLGIRRR